MGSGLESNQLAILGVLTLFGRGVISLSCYKKCIVTGTSGLRKIREGDEGEEHNML